MNIVTFDELPAGWEVETVLLKHLVFGSSWDPRSLTPRRFKQRYPAYADYGGLCAVERGRVVSSFAIHRFPFRARQGLVRCSGLGAVATQPTFSRRGFAKHLIEEAHRRERASGSAFMLLFTNRYQVAHALYEKLGYRDVLDFRRAIRKVPARRYDVPAGWQWRPATGQDRTTVERLFSFIARRRFGFTREVTGWWPGPRQWFLLERRGVLAAFANLEKQGRIFACQDVATMPGPARTLLLRCLESEAAGAWLMLGTTVLRELWSGYISRNYSMSMGSYGVLMGLSLRESGRTSKIAHELGADDPRFLVGASDSF